MMYEDPPIQPDKGKYLGSCNRTACQKPGANWYNFVTRAHYCQPCAKMINYAPLPGGRYLCAEGENAGKDI